MTYNHYYALNLQLILLRSLLSKIFLYFQPFAHPLVKDSIERNPYNTDWNEVWLTQRIYSLTLSSSYFSD